MAGARKRKNKDGVFYPEYQGWYIDRFGKQRYFIGNKSKKETEAKARKYEEREMKIRSGDISPDRPMKDKPFNEIRDEYLSWGKLQGGRTGRPWGKTHLRMVESYLEFWQQELKLQKLSDLYGCLPKVEKTLQKLKEKGRSGKTLTSYASGLIAFCNWCVDRDYLPKNPLSKLSSLNSEPKFIRRALTLDEIYKLLDSCEPSRRLLYEMALNTGLRAGELGHLKVKDLDLESGGVLLRSAWTKNRKDGFQPVPRWLMEKLLNCVKGKKENDPILEVPSHPAREMDKDLVKAGIPKHTHKGKVDFHALRVAFITLLFEVGNASPKEAQELARHSTINLTMNVYTRTRDERLKNVTETLGESMKR